MHFVACKTVREYNRNREKIRMFCLEEKRQIQRDQGQVEEQSTQAHRELSDDQAGPSAPTSDQAGPSSQQDPPPRPTNSKKRRTERKRRNASPSKRTTRQIKNKPSEFEQKSMEAALAQTKLMSAKKRHQQNRQKGPTKKTEATTKTDRSDHHRSDQTL